MILSCSCQFKFSLVNSQTCLHSGLPFFWYICFSKRHLDVIANAAVAGLRNQDKKDDLKLMPSIFFYFTKRTHFTNYKKRFLFDLKSSFCSQDIKFFVIFFPSFSQFADSKGSKGSKGQMKLE